MEFSEVLARRCSCRQYTDRPVEREKLETCLQAGRQAPSGCNSQRWLFIAVDDDSLRTKIAAALDDPDMSLNGFAHQIPAFVVIVKHPPRRLTEKQQQILGERDDSLLDIGIAAQQICLAATDRGLGSIMLGWFRSKLIREALGIPDELEIALVIGLGYAATDTVRRPVRYPTEEIIRWNGYVKKERDSQ